MDTRPNLVVQTGVALPNRTRRILVVQTGGVALPNRTQLIRFTIRY